MSSVSASHVKAQPGEMASTPLGHSITVGRIVLEVTRRCPRRCGFCYLQVSSPAEERAAREELSARDLAALTLTLAKATGCEAVQLSGGEPLVRPDLPELLGRLRAEGLGVTLLTDGAGLSPEVARRLVKGGLATVQPTLLAGTATIHDALRGPGAFQATTRAIAAAASAGLPVSVSYVITAQNAEATLAREVTELAFALGARTLALCRFCPTGPAARGALALLPTAAQVETAARAVAKACRRLGLSGAAAIPIPACVFADPLRPPVPGGLCALVSDRTVLTLGPQGSLRSCALSERPVGNLRDAPFHVLWERLLFEELLPLRAARPPACESCPAWAGCRGGCRLSALAATGRRDGMDPIAPVSGAPPPRRAQ